MPPVHYQENNFPPTGLDWEMLSGWLGDAHHALTRYDERRSALRRGVPIHSVLLSVREAVLSSRIEGTFSSVSDVFMLKELAHVESPSSSRQRDGIDVQNFDLTLKESRNMCENGPLSEDVLKESHRILMDAGHCSRLMPGSYRDKQNWIGGRTPETADYIPPNPTLLPTAMQELAGYIREDSRDDKLVRSAIIHGQFEALHPFCDGNGRIGRMLVPLFLWKSDLIELPLFYMSSFLDAFRADYFHALFQISAERQFSEREGWSQWCRFFLQGVICQSQASIARLERISSLYEECCGEWPGILKSRHHHLLRDWVFRNPICRRASFTRSSQVKEAGISQATAGGLFRRLCKAGYLVEISPASGRRAAVHRFQRLIDLLEEDDDFGAIAKEVGLR